MTSEQHVSNDKPATTTQSEGTSTEPITLVQSGGALGSIFGMLDPASISSCNAEGVCN